MTRRMGLRDGPRPALPRSPSGPVGPLQWHAQDMVPRVDLRDKDAVIEIDCYCGGRERTVVGRRLFHDMKSDVGLITINEDSLASCRVAVGVRPTMAYWTLMMAGPS